MKIYTDQQLKEFAQRINNYANSDEFKNSIKMVFDRLNLVARQSSEVLKERLKDE